jgi:hypothetical protein
MADPGEFLHAVCRGAPRMSRGLGNGSGTKGMERISRLRKRVVDVFTLERQLLTDARSAR